MSPVLFSIFIEQMVRRLKQARVGIKLDAQLMFTMPMTLCSLRSQPRT